ncbi:MAG: isoleucine--tRNA ligase [Propionibacteriaceae bacterium]|jgi:isoleucyl-tRNA synthetase|nr:isoleucine--tRNA ligase [Propionibacteriaceae bacterium]
MADTASARPSPDATADVEAVTPPVSAGSAAPATPSGSAAAPPAPTAATVSAAAAPPVSTAAGAQATGGPRLADPLAPVYNAVPPQVDLPALEHGILALWAQQDTFARSLDRPDAPVWTFYEGPPTANGVPGAHHIESRAFKDVFPRFKTMQGYRVPRKAGWDCHGLPVELAVEKELGFSGKPDIEAYGVEAFNERCRESVGRHVDMWSQLTERMGFWVNLDDAYWTMSPEFVQSAWWALKQIHARGCLVEDYRVAPYCPRCGTTLSDHELAQGYEDVTDTTVFVRLPLLSGPLAHQASLLVWTTTPWTLISNLAAAVNPDVAYVAASDGQETLIVAEPLVDAVLGEGWTVVSRHRGRDMARWRYRRPFDVVDLGGQEANFVITADYVTTADGTGVVHQAPAFGEEDMAACRAWGLPFVNPIRPDGAFEADLPLVGGLFFKSADKPVIRDLEEQGLLFRAAPVTHSYPHCWRCHTLLIYYAQPSWYIRTTAVKEALLRENEATNWHPEHIKHGRYGDWLANNVDWALSRKRYWGTPLPIWRCADGHQTCVGSLAELSELSGHDQSGLDPHRPFVDAVTFPCPACGGLARRVPEVIDAWFDSGSMPFGQWGYPWAPGSKERFEGAFPADYICEAIDQTRGWFYSLMAVSTLVFDRNSYRNVICLGHILAEDGKKMSKHLGNILEPLPLLERHGADAVRWFMLAGGSPWASRRVGHAAIQETVRKVLLTYWNAVSFQSLYARVNGWSPRPGGGGAVKDRHVLDRWLVSATQVLIGQVTEALENFDTLRAGTLLADFIDELSNWHIRRSRRRFWEGDDSALSTLHETLDALTRLMAPIAPFTTERVWQDLFVAVDPAAPASVHLAAWPVADPTLADADLAAAMSLARRIVELGRAARSEARVKIRQPLSRVLVSSAALARLGDELLAEVRSELNVERIESFTSAGDLVDYSAKADFRALGKRFGKETAAVAAAVAAADPDWLAAALAADGQVTLDYGGGTVLTADEIVVSERPRQGWSVVGEQGETVALDLELTDELIRAGWVREVVRGVQELRKQSGLEVSDRIRLSWSAEDEVGAAVAAAADAIAAEVLAVEMIRLPEAGPGWTADKELPVAYALAKA